MSTGIQSLIDAGALFVSNHSGGKDSQAMLIKLLDVIPARQLVVVHASLGAIEWPGALELARGQAKSAGVPFIVARASKTLFEMVERRFENRPEVPSIPLASADSTNVARNIGIDKAWKGSYAPASKETRAALMVERIESHNSPGSLAYCEQRDRFDMQLQLAV